MKGKGVSYRKCIKSSQFSAAKSSVYVLNTDYNADGRKLAVQLSDCTIKVYDQSDKELSTFVNDTEVTKIKFSRQDPKLLFASSLDGKINVWDTRTQKVAQTFIDDSDTTLKPLTCLDFNLEERYLCAGTDLIREDAFLIFWDMRWTKLLGGYWDGHTGEITQVHFHPEKNHILGSGAADGLINIYDLNEQTEDDALIHTINVDAGISTFCWRPSDMISCTSSLEDYQLWKITEGRPECSRSLKGINADVFKVPVDYMIDTFLIEDLGYLATGLYTGTVHLWYTANLGLTPAYVLAGGHTDVVRSIMYNKNKQEIVTGGEDGNICKWKIPPVESRKIRVMHTVSLEETNSDVEMYEST